MKLPALIAACCLPLALGAHQRAAAQTPSRALPDVVLLLEDTLNAAWLRHDTLTVGRLIGGDFRGITARGREIARVDMLRAAAHNDETATEVTSRSARRFGDVVVTTGRITDRGRRSNGEAFVTVTLVTNVWARRGASWQLVAAHESTAP